MQWHENVSKLDLGVHSAAGEYGMDADVAHMWSHHQQPLGMATLVNSRSRSDKNGLLCASLGQRCLAIPLSVQLST